MTPTDAIEPTATSLRSADALLLDFIAPGLVHALGNHLFAIQGSAHVLGASRQMARHRENILDACTRAEHAVDVLRHVGPGDADPPRQEQAGLLLMRMTEVCRVPLRERGVRLELAHSSKDSPRRVDARTLCRAVAELLRCVAEEVPACFAGELRLDLCEQERARVGLELRLRADPGCLPFPIGLSAARVRSAGVVAPLGVQVEVAEQDRLLISIPASGRAS